jgi:hypothetical protein
MPDPRPGTYGCRPWAGILAGLAGLKRRNDRYDTPATYDRTSDTGTPL